MFRLEVPTTEPLPERGVQRLLKAATETSGEVLSEYFRSRALLLASIKSAYVHSETARGAYDDLLPHSGGMVALCDTFDIDERDRLQKFLYVWSTGMLRGSVVDRGGSGGSGGSSSSGADALGDGAGRAGGASGSGSGGSGKTKKVLGIKSARFDQIMLVASLGVQYWAQAHGTLYESIKSNAGDEGVEDGTGGPPSVHALKAAYQALRKAAGVFVTLQGLVAEFVDAPEEFRLPLEATPTGALVLEQWARGEAESCLLFHSLAEGKMSLKLAAKVAASVMSRFAKVESSLTPAFDVAIAPYITARKDLAEGIWARCRAQMASEDGEHGLACAYIDVAAAAAQTVRADMGIDGAGSSSSLGLLASLLGGQKASARYRPLVPLAAAELESIEEKHSAYHHDNDLVYFETLPARSSLDKPVGMQVAAPEPFDLPAPAFDSIELKPDESSSCVVM